ncbi:hypothetical protein PF008_g15258 [Phytophthora fragariae]|uniref:Uncharacterized protein n=1 Tax=Phytophthora fragariae TaxID=53985 RepID=A0A6G0REP8_9STRA|nr:hypothetical protein PF008_g15258 [Phytophthora fragariae]
MLAATVTVANEERAWIPAANAHDRAVVMPSKKELGTWIPVDDDTTILGLDELLSEERLNEWINELGDSVTPPEQEDQVNVGDPSARGLITKLLRVYRGARAIALQQPPSMCDTISIRGSQRPFC